MRAVSQFTADTWVNGRFDGPTRPMVRATIQRLSVRCRTYGGQTYSSLIHGQSSVPVELPNIKTVKWARGTDGAATMTLTLFNTAPLPLGTTPGDDREFDQPGYYSPGRGKSFGSPSWTHQANGWRDWIVPDRVIRTYEGYGFDATTTPEHDVHLYKSGTWIIDDVSFKAGIITVECRDFGGKPLLDQILMPPIVPMASYPLYFSQYQQVDNPDVVTTVGTGWYHPRYSNDSSLVDGYPSIFGHTGADAFDGSASSYWISVGHVAPNDGYCYQWVEGKITSGTVSAFKVHVWAGPYTCYISVFSDGKWQGNKIVPYNPDNAASRPNGGNIPYVKSLTVEREETVTVQLPKAYKNVTKVRVCFTNLYDSGTVPYRYRCGVRDFQIAGTTTVTKDGGKHQEPRTSPPGFADYSDIVKILLAYAGWHWPQEATDGFYTTSDGLRVPQAAPSHDPVLRSGRVWGDIQTAGTNGVAPLGVSIWDKKPVMDGINYIKDLLGFIFFIDEDGAAIFRAPNVWSIGNWVGNGSAGAGRSAQILEIADDQVMLDFEAKLTSRNIREKVFVANLAGNKAGMANGHNPYPSGLRRVGGWTDQHFTSEAECRIMADLIALRQLFTYRTDTVTVPGFPMIQVDDQVRLYERESEEMYLHYVESIQMDFDMKSGKYTYQLGTHWLGDVPFTSWSFDPKTMSPETQAYLQALGLWHP